MTRDDPLRPSGSAGGLPHLLVLAGVWPTVAGAREAANVVSHQILLELARTGAFRISVQVLNWEVADPSDVVRGDLETLRQAGVEVLPALTLGAPGRLRTRLPWGLAHAWSEGTDVLLPGADRFASTRAALMARQPDVVLTIWSELCQNVASRLPVPLVAYAGNPDHKVLAANLELAALTGRPRRPLLQAMEPVMKAAHLAVMRRFDRVYNVAQNDANDYREAGVRAEYIQNMWPVPRERDWAAERDRLEVSAPLRIVGNVGNLAATGNSFGLWTLARTVLPRLRARLGDGTFEIHLFGAPPLRDGFGPVLDDPHVKVRGFVPDLDAEIMAAPVFLVANNSHAFKVGHTRFLHAWSLGACCVGFSDIREAMPEVVHEHNALLGATADDLVDCIIRAGQDVALRRRLGRHGQETLRASFAPPRVVGHLASDIASLLRDRAKGGPQRA